MSFRELRNFCEMLRSLGYSRLVSMENFRSPNFELVADILDWLCHRFEPGCNISDDISTEQHRVTFIKTVCEKIYLRTGMKLNSRKLYGADGFAVKELLKLATMLHEAQRSVGEAPPDNDENFALNSKLSDLKSTRSLCSQIVEAGAELFDGLQREKDVRQDRDKALRFLDGISRNLDSNTEHEVVERAVMGMLQSHGANLGQMKTMTEDLQRDEKQLEGKIKKKRQELDRSQKRLSSLVNVRPAFMDEYERMEQELERYYEQYVDRFRNLDYLEHELDTLNKEVAERMEENERALKKMQKRLREEEWKLLRGEEDGDGKKKSKAGAGRSKQSGQGRPAVQGSMDNEDDDDDEDDDSSVSGSDDDSEQPIEVGGSQSDDPPVSLGNSGSDDDILNESDDDDDISDDGGGGGKRGGANDYDF